MDIPLTGLILTPQSTITSVASLQTGGKDPGWQPGQVFDGIVIGRMGENSYVISVDGKDVIALSPFILAENQAITMEVQGKRDGQYMVKLLDPVLTGQSDALSSVINKLGLEDSVLNRILVRGFWVNELPLKPELLQQAARMLQLSGGSLNENVDAVLLALKWGGNLRPGVLEVVRDFVSGFRENAAGSENQMARHLQQLDYLLNAGFQESQPNTKESPAALPESAPSIVLSKEGAVLFQQVKDRLQGTVLKPAEGTEKVAEQLRNLLTLQLPRSVQNEANVQPWPAFEGVQGETVTDNMKTPPSMENEFSPPLAQGGLPAPEVEKNLFKDGNPSIIVSEGDRGGQNSGGVAGKAEDVYTPAPDGFKGANAGENHGKESRAFSELLVKFGRLLQEVRVSLKEAGLLQKGQPIVHEEEIILRQMAGHQIFQSLQRDNPGQDQNYLYFNLPFISNGETETWGRLRIMKNTGDKKIIDPVRFSTAIFLNTKNLGPLLMELNVWNKDVTASVKVTKERVAQMMNKAWPKIQEPFKAMGYRLGHCRLVVGPFKEDLRPVESIENEKPLRLLDTRV